MSAPEILCVDDSEAILAFERSVLARHYVVSTATDGLRALEAMARRVPACVLLDLSMPALDGDAVLAKMKMDARLHEVPVVVVSSEAGRAAECLAAGAVAFLAKPLRAADLEACVAQALEQDQRRRRAGSLAILRMGVGSIELAVTLEGVVAVVLQPETAPLPGGPPHVASFIEYHGEPACVLDLAVALGVAHAVPLVERRLAIVERAGRRLAVAVDRVADPEEVAAADIAWRAALGGGEHPPLDAALVAIVRAGGARVPVIEPSAFLAPGLLDAVPALLAKARAEAPA